MLAVFDPKDVALSGAPEMRLALQAVIKAGRSGVFMRGAEERDRVIVEELFWKTYEGRKDRGGIALIRLWYLVEAMQSRRLQDLFLGEGYAFLETAVMAAATLRLNMDWGFAPQRLIWSIDRVKAARAVSRLGRSQRLSRPVAMATAAA